MKDMLETKISDISTKSAMEAQDKDSYNHMKITEKKQQIFNKGKIIELDE
jgi:hypothetical protein